MFNGKKIKNIHGREILDSRGNPTVSVRVTLESGISATASVPSGASTGSHEAWELRDTNVKRYGGKGVRRAVAHVNGPIKKLICGMDVSAQQDIDRLMVSLDGTTNKSALGANAILGVSLACAHTAARALSLPLYRYLRRTYKIHYPKYILPVPMMNVLNGGAHAGWTIDIQECMIVPFASTMAKRVQIGSEVFHALGALLKQKGFDTNKGDEGGYAVRLKKNEHAFSMLELAVRRAGYTVGHDVSFAIDAAASEFYDERTKRYQIDGKRLTSDQMTALYVSWLKKHKLISIEDGLAEDDWYSWGEHTRTLGKKCTLVGDDLFVTNIERLKRGIDAGVANAILIKPNQIGTLTETIAAIHLAKISGYKVIISHRSGETCDTTIADLAVAVNAEYIKTGSLSRSERVEKYNRLMEIEEELSTGR